MSLTAPESGHTIGPTGLRLAPGLDYEDWLTVGRRLIGYQNATSWALGDWLFYGEWTYGRHYEDALALTGLSYQTLANLKTVAGRFDVSRRREKLSHGHHAELAALAPEEQDRWLDLAEDLDWTREQLREARARAADVVEPAPAPEAAGDEIVLTTTLMEQLTFSVTAEQAERWRAAAAACDLELEEWVADVCDRAA